MKIREHLIQNEETAVWKVQQRVISKNEPELGIGIVEVINSDNNTVEIHFPCCDQLRCYSLESLPLKRVIFQKGEQVQDLSGEHLRVDKVEIIDGLAYYDCNSQCISEDQLSPTLILQKSTDLDHILSLNPEKSSYFALRQEAQQIQNLSAENIISAFSGARINILPHQIYLAHKISQRTNVRILLADEVGLGKTIEAALIIAALKAQEKASKILIITPDNLIHQWMIELYKRFGLLFTIIDEKRCQEESTPSQSVFNNHQNIIIPASLIAQENQTALQQILQEDWDLVSIDEAHHLNWDLNKKKWNAAVEISQNTQHLLLLTATPRQQGLNIQFGLLHLLDPQKFNNFNKFLEEQEKFYSIAQCVKKIKSKNPEHSIKNLSKLIQDDKEIITLLNKNPLSPETIDKIISLLIDRHGTGKVFFQNRRSCIPGFPKRKLNAIAIAFSKEYQKVLNEKIPEKLTPKELLDFATGRKQFCVEEKNNKYLWLKEFLQTKIKNEKVLLMCSKSQYAQEIQKLLEQENINTAIFHEQMSLLKCDQESIRFSDPDGPDIMISSQVGGEGRNFQFVKKIIMFDMPSTPELLEQRIGRLDRIGQENDIEIILPYLQNSPEEVFFKWYNQALLSFEKFQKASGDVFEEFAEQLLELIKTYFPNSHLYPKKEILSKKLFNKAAKYLGQKSQEIEQSSDVLIDINSFDKQKAQSICESIEDLEDNPSLEIFIRNFLDYNEIEYSDFDDRGSLLIHNEEELPFSFNFNNNKKHYSNVITFDRDTALQRENFAFVSYGSFFAQKFISTYLDSGKGKLSLCKYNNKGLECNVVYQFIFAIKGLGPKRLQLSKYMPANSKLISTIKHKVYENNIDEHKIKNFNANELDDIKNSIIWEQIETAITKNYEIARENMKQSFEKLQKTSINKIKNIFQDEKNRLIYLKSTNPNITDSDLTTNDIRRAESIKYLNNSCFYLDSIRIILCT
jgi:ATP-dependent helicase HepA